MTNPLSTGQVSLYFALLHVCNRSNWTEWFQAPNSVISVLTGLSRSGILKSRNELKQRGLIDFRERGTKSTLYHLTAIANSTQDSVQESTQEGESDATMSNSTQDSTQKGVQKGVQNSTQKGAQNSTPIKRIRQRDLSPDGDCMAAPETPSVIVLPLHSGGEYPVTETQVQEWASLYPGVDVMQELRNMRGWLLANPDRNKTARGILRFVTTWLQKEQAEYRNGQPVNGQAAASVIPQASGRQGNPRPYLAYPQRDYGQGGISEIEKRMLEQQNRREDAVQKGTGNEGCS